eukprot:2604625-Ditylum_brightwellii.AAC.1
MAALNKAKKKQKKEKEVEINAFNTFQSLNIESSGKEGELKESAPAADSNSDSKIKASPLLSNDSDSDVSA